MKHNSSFSVVLISWSSPLHRSDIYFRINKLSTDFEIWISSIAELAWHQVRPKAKFESQASKMEDQLPLQGVFENYNQS